MHLWCRSRLFTQTQPKTSYKTYRLALIMQCYVLERIMLNGWVEYLVFHEKDKAVKHAEALMQSHDVDACQIHTSHIMDRRD